MRSKRGMVLSSVILIVALLGTTALAASPAQQEAPPALHLADQGASDVPPGLTISEYAPEQRGYYIVQFRGPIEQAWKDEVAALGGDILSYIPDFAFKVRMNPGQAAQNSRSGQRGAGWHFPACIQAERESAEPGQRSVYRAHRTRRGLRSGPCGGRLLRR